VSSPTWDEMLVGLRQEFLREGEARLKRMTDAVARLGKTDAEQAVRDLRVGFHAFTGSGSSFGFPGVTAVGRQGEDWCVALLRDRTAPGPPEIQRCRELLEALRAEMDRPPTSSPPATLPAPGQEPAGAAVRPRAVLIVDDDSEVLSTLSRHVEQEGMKVRLARSCAEAVREMDESLPDAAVVDIVLPDGSGYELVSRLRGLPGGDKPPVLVVSVQTGFLDKVEATHCGADGYFEKPVDWEALMRRLIHLLDNDQPGVGRILSVEDDAVQAAMLRTILEAAGYQVRVCSDPRRFEADLTSFKPDLVLMDAVLPSVSGYDLVRYVRQHEQYAALPVVFLSAEGRMEAQIRAAEVGADDHLQKPVVPALLLTSVAARIERSRFLRGLLSRDGLTRLLTHTAFLERARAAVARAKRPRSRPVIWVMIDIDRFKSVNDRFGHPVGDRVLAALAALLRRRLRPSDTVGRYGGEEFAMLLDDLTVEEAQRLVDRLREEFATISHTDAEGGAFFVTFSAGAALFDPRSMDVDAWREAADQALYAAKGAGRNRVLFAPQAP